MRWTRFWGWGRDVATNLPGDVVGPLEGSLPLDATPLVATGGEATVEGGTAGLAFTVPASGSQVAAQDGTATVATGGGTLAVAATGSEAGLESGTATAAVPVAPPETAGAGWLPARYFPGATLRLRPRGAEVGSESGGVAVGMADLWADENEAAILAALEVA